MGNAKCRAPFSRKRLKGTIRTNPQGSSETSLIPAGQCLLWLCGAGSGQVPVPRLSLRAVSRLERFCTELRTNLGCAWEAVKRPCEGCCGERVGRRLPED